jgi:hypothetical protein
VTADEHRGAIIEHASELFESAYERGDEAAAAYWATIAAATAASDAAIAAGLPPGHLPGFKPDPELLREVRRRGL